MTFHDIRLAVRGGVRMALGAGRLDVLAMVVRQGALLTLTGVAAGLIGASA